MQRRGVVVNGGPELGEDVILEISAQPILDQHRKQLKSQARGHGGGWRRETSTDGRGDSRRRRGGERSVRKRAVFDGFQDFYQGCIDRSSLDSFPIHQ
jgi:hypothetical protein